jgi:hypothetical protein
MSFCRNAVVISNCQAPLLANALTVLSLSTMFHSWGVHMVVGPTAEQQIDQFIEEANRDYDLIVTVPLSNSFFGLSSDRIVESFPGKPVLKISNIYFHGLHPDITYIGARGARIVSPIGEYHSKLVLWGYCNRKSVEEVESLFCHDSFSKLGYFDVWETSLAEAKQRDLLADVRITDIWAPILKSLVSFYSVNHPTPALLAPYSGAIAETLAKRQLVARSSLRASPFLMDVSLFQNAVFPVYPEIAQFHGVPSFGGYAFKPVAGRVNPLPLHDFIRKSFDAYEEAGRSAVEESVAAQSIARTLSVLN